MKQGFRLFWNDQVELYKFAKKHPVLFIGIMLTSCLVLNWMGILI